MTAAVATAVVLVAIGAPALAALALLLRRRRRWSVDLTVHHDTGDDPPNRDPPN